MRYPIPGQIKGKFMSLMEIDPEDPKRHILGPYHIVECIMHKNRLAHLGLHSRVVEVKKLQKDERKENLHFLW
jgi:hypothetical protein